MLAEQLLARACENEAENAKRMRMGMEPVSQAQPSQIVTSQVTNKVYIHCCLNPLTTGSRLCHRGTRGLQG